jgi:radical SAM-linked protein
MESREVLLDKSKTIKTALQHLRNVKVSYRDPDVTLMETVVARGDRAVGRLALRAWELGSRLDAWEEQFSFERWQQAAVDSGISFDDYSAAILPDADLPWQAIHVGVNRRFLADERSKAYAGTVTSDCRSGECSVCGACDIAPLLLVERKSKSELPAAGAVGGLKKSPTRMRHFYRVFYQKNPSVRFLGHRDLSDAIIRAIIAADIPLEYSEGFHPHPRVAFGPPLPLGVAGLREAFDIVTGTELSIDLGAINARLPGGLQLIEAVKSPVKLESIQASIVNGRYRFEWLGNEDPTGFTNAISGFQNAKSVIVESERNETRVAKEIRSLVSEIAVVDPLSGIFEASLSMESGRSCSPSDLVSALFPGRKLFDFLVTRLECFGPGRKAL